MMAAVFTPGGVHLDELLQILLGDAIVAFAPSISNGGRLLRGLEGFFRLLQRPAGNLRILLLVGDGPIDLLQSRASTRSPRFTMSPCSTALSTLSASTPPAANSWPRSGP